MSVGGSLLVVVGLILALGWAVRRFTGLAGNRNGLLKIRAVLPVGARERIVLVEAGGKQLLVGITAQTINTLHVFEQPLVEVQPADGEFAEKLKEWLHRTGASDKPDSP